MNAMKHILRWNIPLVPEIHHHHYNIISASENSVVMQGCHGDNNIVANGSIYSEQLTEQEIEMLRLFRSFDMRRKTEAMACLFKIEDNMKGVETLG